MGLPPQVVFRVRQGLNKQKINRMGRRSEELFKSYGVKIRGVTVNSVPIPAIPSTRVLDTDSEIRLNVLLKR